MSWRRVVSLLLFVCIALSSTEVLWADASSAAEPVTVAVASAQPPGGLDSLTGADQDTSPDDCACLCACACAGVQTVVLPPSSTAQTALQQTDRPFRTLERAPASTFLARHFRPPLA